MRSAAAAVPRLAKPWLAPNGAKNKPTPTSSAKAAPPRARLISFAGLKAPPDLQLLSGLAYGVVTLTAVDAAVRPAPLTVTTL